MYTKMRYICTTKGKVIHTTHHFVSKRDVFLYACSTKQHRLVACINTWGDRERCMCLPMFYVTQSFNVLLNLINLNSVAILWDCISSFIKLILFQL